PVFSRRDWLRGASMFVAVSGAPLNALTLAIPPIHYPTAAQLRLIRDVGQQVIPRSETAGAGEVGADAFVILALAHGLEGARQPLSATDQAKYAAHLLADGSVDHLGWLETELNARAKGRFLALPAPTRTTVLAALDTEAFATRDPHPWKTLKSLILTGYYTSETGGSKELEYDAVPGHFDPDVLVTPATRASSTDWTALAFG
ncbi:MAG: gluconate 2-dehydrogenase subunit 3 family protein, partial [Alphaproteobacteria bacterium]|nr:gluconate 2-dehydrogenase subunit 3 family protein [Alphaproteobacteria bacterium]